MLARSRLMTLFQPDRLLIGGLMLYMGAVFAGPAAYQFVRQKFHGTVREKAASVHILLCLLTGLNHMSYAFDPADRASSATQALDILSILLLVIACVALIVLKDLGKSAPCTLPETAQ